MALTDYKSSLESVVEKDSLTGKYTVNTSKYSFGVKIGDDTYEYTPESSGGSEEPTTEPEEPTTNPEEPTEDGE